MIVHVDAFTVGSVRWTPHPSPTALFAAPPRVTKLPRGISPFEKSLAKGMDIQANFRKMAIPAIEKAIRDGRTKLEIDFPPFVGGDQSKTQFDDYDNLQELNANRDWCVQLAPMLATSPVISRSSSTSSSNNRDKRSLWLVLPDDKECELARQEWGGGQLFRRAAKFTSLRAAVLAVAGESSYSKAWGMSIASMMNKLSGGDGILADSSTLDSLDDVDATELFYLICQPGNGGPVEDWINVEKLSTARPFNSITCVVNGALDKVRDGYYPGLLFPALAASVPFYKDFEPVFVLKPIASKGVYGWLFRVYPEPWQVVLQTAARPQSGTSNPGIVVDDTLTMVSPTRPSYNDAVASLLRAAQVGR